MSKLRKTVQKEVIEILNNSFFTSDDFYVYFDNEEKDEDEDENVLLRINFKHDENLYIEISKTSNNYLTEQNPGNIEQYESLYHDDFRDALQKITSWCNEVSHELKASIPVYKEVDKLKKIIEDHIIGENNEEEFSVEEINELRSKFDELRTRVEKLEEQQIITGNQKEEFTNGLNQVSESLEYYPKSTWVKTASNKLVKLLCGIGRSKEGRKLLENGAKKFFDLE